MKPSPSDKAQISFLLPDLERQLDPRNTLFRLARAMDWSVFEKEFWPFYCTEGRPAMLIERMTPFMTQTAMCTIAAGRAKHIIDIVKGAIANDYAL